MWAQFYFKTKIILVNLALSPAIACGVYSNGVPAFAGIQTSPSIAYGLAGCTLLFGCSGVHISTRFR